MQIAVLPEHHPVNVTRSNAVQLMLVMRGTGTVRHVLLLVDCLKEAMLFPRIP
jgi:hypothetical protein